VAIYTGADVESDLELSCDVCIVGSGAGGAVVAERLATAGKSVIVLEDGGFHASESFDMTERNMTSRLYQERGGRATTDLSIAILQGRAVGGTTVINWTTCFRTPERVFEHWAEHHKVEGISHSALVPHWEALEKRLNVTKMALHQVNANNRKTWDGLEKLGWHKDLLSRNVKQCAHTGYCGLGCPIDAKQSMLVTFIPDAVRAGTDIYANAWVERVERDGRRCSKVVAKVRHPVTDLFTGHTLSVTAKVVVLAAGGINTPALLLRSKVDANGCAGRRTFLHPALAGLGVHHDRIDPFVGSPQYVHSEELVDRGPDKMGMLLEGFPLTPGLLGALTPQFGKEKNALEALLPHISSTGVLLHDGFDVHDPDEGARVSLKPSGMPRVDYKWSERFVEGLKTAALAIGRVQLAAGARQVVTPHAEYARTEGELRALLDAAKYGPNQIGIAVAHVMGGCAMGTDEKTSVVDSRTMRHHGFDNVFVIDGSVYPTSLTVNPQLSIYGLASWASGFVREAV
jgi:choline dehydrogenase-like flavoprotein